MQKEREEALANFKNGRHLLLVATAVAARGLGTDIIFFHSLMTGLIAPLVVALLSALYYKVVRSIPTQYKHFSTSSRLDDVV